MESRYFMLSIWLLFAHVSSFSMGATLAPKDIKMPQNLLNFLDAPGIMSLPDYINGGCGNKTCGRYSYRRILSTYKNLFQTSVNITNLQNVYNGKPLDPFLNNASEIMDRTKIYTDISLCCSTKIEHFSYKTMVNVFGEERTIIQLEDNDPPFYQFIPQASCLSAGNCSGKCVLQSMVIMLLAMDNQGWSIELEDYDYEILYRKGKSNPSDFLSRNKHDNEEVVSELEDCRYLYSCDDLEDINVVTKA